MIIDLEKFITEERPYWEELEKALDALERDSARRLEFGQVKRFHYLYQRTSADLAKIVTFASEPKVRQYLESLVGRAYGEIHETRERPYRFSLRKWFFHTFPIVFRRHVRAFWLALTIMLVGSLFGGLAICFDPEAKEVVMPFSHLLQHPSERVAKEEEVDKDRLQGAKAMFSSHLMTHNTKVAIFTLALGITWGVGTLLMLFYNGIILGAVAFDYILAGETEFLAGWLLPHGVVEIPAILLAGQAGLVLAGALIGWGKPESLRKRFRKISSDLATLIFGVGILLIWAGIVESFFSQYHEPIIPYGVKIGFGVVELVLLTLFLWKSGKKQEIRAQRA